MMANDYIHTAFHFTVTATEAALIAEALRVNPHRVSAGEAYLRFSTRSTD